MPDEAASTPPTLSILEREAEKVARDVEGEPVPGERGLGLTDIIEIVIAMLQTLVQKCPQPAPQIAESLRKPSIGQRAVLRKQCHEMVEEPAKARKVFRSMVNRGAQLSEVDARAVVREAGDDSNLLL